MNFDRGVLLALLLSAPASGCSNRASVLHPYFEDGGMLAGAEPLSQEALEALAGMYEASGEGALGGTVVVHPALGTLSIFAAPNAAYAIMKGGCIDEGTRVVFEGHWRYPSLEDTGLVRLFIDDPAAASALCAAAPVSGPLPVITLVGATGIDMEEPSSELSVRFDHPLVDAGDHFIVAAHHGACRTIDDCGASENSVRSIEMVESFGAKAVEVDARVTAEGIPILYHDDVFDARLSKGLYCRGPVEEMNLVNLRASCRLVYGEEIPTLDEALSAALHRTRLEAVWIDLKVPEAVKPSLDLALHYNELAKTIPGRTFSVVLGLPDEDVIAAYLAASPPPGTPCLVEQEPSEVRRVGCHFWGPRWTRGPMAEEVAALQEDGHAVVFWTLDEVEFINLFLKAGKPNGILSDRSGLVLQRFQSAGVIPEGSVRP